MNNAIMPAGSRTLQKASYRRKTGPTAKQTSLEGLRPLVNQLNQYFEKTRQSSAPSQA